MGKNHYKWPFSIAMLNYQRVPFQWTFNQFCRTKTMTMTMEFFLRRSHEKPASQPRLASTRHQDAKGQGDPRQRWDLYTGLPALSGFVASVGGLLLLVKRNETNVSPLKGWYNCITLARYGYATNRYIYIYTRIYTYIYIIYWFGDGRTLCGFWPTNTRAKHRLQGGVSLKSGARKWCHKAWANLQMWLTSTWINNGTLALG